MKPYTNPFHNGHLYLKIGEAEAGAIRPSQFDELIEAHRKPLQVMVSSDETRVVDLLRRAGFVLKRRCYEIQAGAEDLILPMTDDFDPLLSAERGTPAYERCAALMYRYYAETHRTVNPLTATEPEFSAILPDLALYETTNGRVSCAAFVEDDEIAYVCSDDRSAFPAFARALVCSVLKRHGIVCFEADDVDWAATELKSLFSVDCDESFDTYVKSLPVAVDERTYLADPCGASSLPFWKTERFRIPDGVTVLRDDVFRESKPDGTDEPYFKLMHDLKNVDPPSLPPEYETVACGVADYAAHIDACYEQEGVTEAELAAYAKRPTYDPSLWIAIRDKASGQIVASGIAELDARIGEGILEWIQVSPEHRRKGLGRFVVNELLRRMQGRAAFCTVSGKRNDPGDPFALYRACGFRDPVIWHVVGDNPCKNTDQSTEEKK
ncbi:MAG: GNAT family N-acetyltransferase [Clostridia bacterium]|nr:GNAT family N-acetyltransferase [Clostridia bacterium]